MSFRICLIGCGGIATGYHGPSYARYAETHPDFVRAACCDSDESRAAAYREQFGFARSYADFAAMLSAERPDAVCLAVPPQLTCALGCEILRLGYPLLMEKPPGLTTTETDRLIAAADASGAPNQVAFNRRYTPLLRRMKRYYSPAKLQHLRYDFTRVGRTDPDFSTTAIHGIDTARFIASCDYERLNFHYQELPHLGPGVANIYVDGAFTSGATVQLNFLPVAGAVSERATLVAPDQTVYLHLPIWNGFDAPGSLQLAYKGKLAVSESGPENTGSTEDFMLNGFYAENATFFGDLQAGRRPECDLRSARQSVEVAQCIRERHASYHC
jgi:myo-inositol 2-dehydrogenase / D-chiro-inositol 1-dehydrogenase